MCRIDPAGGELFGHMASDPLDDEHRRVSLVAAFDRETTRIGECDPVAVLSDLQKVRTGFPCSCPVRGVGVVDDLEDQRIREDHDRDSDNRVGEADRTGEVRSAAALTTLAKPTRARARETPRARLEVASEVGLVDVVLGAHRVEHRVERGAPITQFPHPRRRRVDDVNAAAALVDEDALVTRPSGSTCDDRVMREPLSMSTLLISAIRA